MNSTVEPTESIAMASGFDEQKKDIKKTQNFKTTSIQENYGQHIVVIGAGPAGVRLVGEILDNNAFARITLCGNEPFEPYNRVQLSSVLAKEVQRDAIFLQLPDTDSHPEFRYVIASIVEINREKKQVIDSLDRVIQYDSLVLATGARAFVPDIPGVALTGVYTFRNLKDTDSLLARLASTKQVVIVGGGLLGLETAKALNKFNTNITVIQQGFLLMNRQLDEAASALLLENIEALGISVRLGSGVREILGKSRVNGVRMRDGKVLSCDTVLFCTGITPNTQLAIDSGLAFNRGIKVNNQLCTNDPSVFAIGECSEYNEITYGLATPGYEQAAVLANRFCGGQAEYRGSMDAAKLKVVGQPLVSIGEIGDEPVGLRIQQLIYKDKEKAIYRKLTLQRGRLTGSLAYGEWAENTRLQEALKGNRYIPFWQRWSFSLTGNLWPLGSTTDITQWPQTSVVCQCNNIDLSRLLVAIDNGCHSIDSLSQSTGAGTVCGSCKPLLAQLTGDTAKPKRLAAWPLLALISLLATSIVMIIGLVPGLQVADSVQDKGFFEGIWNDKFYKQVTGFSLLGLTVLALTMSLRKRIPRIRFGSFDVWRMVHSLLGVAAIGILVAHTGLHLGENLNRLLIFNFLAVVIVGAVTGFVLSLSHMMSLMMAKRLRECWAWLHILLTWPLPVLIILHIVSVYYF